jgi:hypothetical protein
MIAKILAKAKEFFGIDKKKGAAGASAEGGTDATQ